MTASESHRYTVEEGDDSAGQYRWIILDRETGKRIHGCTRWEARQVVGWMNEDERIALYVFP